MERFKGKLEDNVEKPLDWVFRNAMGNPVVFNDTPTKATMKANTWGYDGDDLYVKFPDGKTLKFSGTDVS